MRTGQGKVGWRAVRTGQGKVGWRGMRNGHGKEGWWVSKIVATGNFALS